MARALGPADGEWALSRFGGHPLAPDLAALYARALAAGWRAAGAGARRGAWALVRGRAPLAQAVGVAAADVVAACLAQQPDHFEQ
ncbi:hypothetical protein MNEG_15979 [Monoraphidium neglectum]|uniref:Uncharacterized protein n=1 Tax=Monoraphidium neglectum TaxID=145388 RepID=A0A0D2K704_9CHLO|nr:hypothetical protein MNEG_15979 [Monoraphidium neglectum]KIY91983.1 hypothetical protein MNEG_15979 [Monoraphidium neglectum]|eukprot:XP_013891003.1 hypothetical protein MNEG_15979 [Monoraphidium neglectum]